MDSKGSLLSFIICVHHFNGGFPIKQCFFWFLVFLLLMSFLRMVILWEIDSFALQYTCKFFYVKELCSLTIAAQFLCSLGILVLKLLIAHFCKPLFTPFFQLLLLGNVYANVAPGDHNRSRPVELPGQYRWLLASNWPTEQTHPQVRY